MKHKSLKDLVVANGFDMGVGSYDQDNWRKMGIDFLSRTNFSKSASVLGIGCGSGPFLFTLNELLQAKYFDLDYSQYHRR